MKDRLVVVVALGVGLLVWLAAADRMGPLLLPEPQAVLRALWTERARLSVATGQTALAATIGLAIASLGAVLTALAAWSSRGLARALLPYITLLQVVPIVAVAPLLVVWLGYGPPVAATTAAIAAFYPVYSAASTGLRAPGSDLVDLLHLYGAPPLRVLWDLRLPAALPALFSGLRTAAGLSVIGAIVGEFVGSNGIPPALGQVVVASARSARMDLCFAAIVAAGALALSLHAVLRFAEHRAIGKWYGA